MHDKTRKLLPVVGALALASSALLASAGSALAKPAPTADLSTQTCESDPAYAYYYAEFDLQMNKGRWVYLRGELKFDGAVVKSLGWAKYDKNKGVSLGKSTGNAPSSVSVSLFLGDRSGETVELNWPICS